MPLQWNNRFSGLPGTVKTSNPNEIFSYNSLYLRFERGQNLFDGDSAISNVTKLNAPNSVGQTEVTSWLYLRDVGSPGIDTTKGYWEVRYATPEESIMHLRGQLPKYYCSCPDHTLRLFPTPINSQLSRKFPNSWGGVLRDCKHIWATRFRNDEIKLINPLPSDIPLSLREQYDNELFGVRSPQGINSIDGVNSINSIVSVNRPDRFEPNDINRI